LLCVILELRGELLSSTPPQVISPDTFPVHLGSYGPAPLNPFNFTYSACLGVGPFGTDADSCSDAKGAATRIVEYVGTATLRDMTPAPVPEPASLLLVGSGLAVLRSSQKRRSKT
jgi:PEP-CTERM motif